MARSLRSRPRRALSAPARFPALLGRTSTILAASTLGLLSLSVLSLGSTAHASGLGTPIRPMPAASTARPVPSDPATVARMKFTPPMKCATRRLTGRS